MSSYTVLCPNGRRQLVKVNPNTRLLEVLEQVCKKQGYSPSEYTLKHTGRKALDLNASVRYSNLTNNAKLELVKASGSRAELPTNIALQLENGERLQRDFLPNDSLWDILKYWEQQEGRESIFGDKGRRPVCIYMRQEIGYGALKSTTLRLLGLTGGRAAIRLLYRDLPELTEEEEVVQKEADVKEKCTEHGGKSPGDGSAVKPMEVETETVKPGEEEKSLVASQSSSEMQQTDQKLALQESHASPAAAAPMSPQDVAPEKMPLEDQLAAGSSIYVQKRKPAATATATEAEGVAFLGLAEAGWTPQYYPQVQLGFSGFKFPKETEGKNLSQQSTAEDKKTIMKPCEREPVVFTHDGAQSPEVAATHDLPESFFEVTISDVHTMAQSLKGKVKNLDAPLMTKSQREALSTAKLQQYERATLRIQFPDRLLLQAFFNPFELVEALYEFVRQSLCDSSCKFELYTAPPKEVLKDKNVSIGKAGLVPASIVYFGALDQMEGPYLSDALMKGVKTFGDAESLAADRASRQAASSIAHASERDRSIQGGVLRAKRKEDNLSGSDTKDQDASKSVPKWFKLGKN